MSIANRSKLKLPQVDKQSSAFLRKKESALDEMVQGYRDGRDPESPQPSANRSLSYVHGFHVGLGDRRGEPFHDAATLRQLAEAALEADALAALR